MHASVLHGTGEARGCPAKRRATKARILKRNACAVTPQLHSDRGRRVLSAAGGPLNHLRGDESRSASPSEAPTSDLTTGLDRTSLARSALSSDTGAAKQNFGHARRFGWYPRRSTLDGVRAFIREGQRQRREGGPRRTLAIRTGDTRTLVGGCETRLQPDGSAEVSWWTFPEHRRQGLATRAVRLMLQYFSKTLGGGKFVALIEPDNHASRGVARSAGFIESGSDTSGPRPMLRHEYSG